MRRKVFLLAVGLSFSMYAFGAVNDQENYKAYFCVGDCESANGRFQTGKDGQLYVTKGDELELRLKQNTLVNLTGNPFALTEELILERGVIGLKVASDTLLLKTPFADIRMRNAKAVFRVSEHLTRVCILEGTCVIMQKTDIVPVSSGNEIAASKNRLSKIYKFLDDLRFVWYWTTPDKEPSISPEKL